MQQAATSIVLIVGQLALLCAAPVYICTSADGNQRIEWGQCECAESGHFHDTDQFAHEEQIATPPCHCEHKPLTEGTQTVSRTGPETRGPLSVSFAEIGIRQPMTVSIGVPVSAVVSPSGHTPLSDRLSICLRC